MSQEVVIYWWSGGGPGLSMARLTSSLSTTSPSLIKPTLKEKQAEAELCQAQTSLS